MFLFLLSTLFSPAISILVETIPPQGPPPMNLVYTSAVYDSYSNSIIIVGGYYLDSNTDTSDIYGFNLTTLKWFQIIPESDFIPKGFELHYLFLTQSREILVFFGKYNDRCISDVYSFDLNSNKWSIQNIQGDKISARNFDVITAFRQNATDYIAVYGGVDNYKYDLALYM
jgi:hypothetical protein